MTPEEIARFDALRDEYRGLSRELVGLLSNASDTGARCIHDMNDVESAAYVRIATRMDELQREFNTFLLGEDIQNDMRGLAERLRGQGAEHRCSAVNPRLH